MDRPEDVAWKLRTLLDGKARLDSENSDGLWLEKVVKPDNTIETLLLLECGGVGIGLRLRKAQQRAKELSVPLRVINGIEGADNWISGRKQAGQPGISPVRMMTLLEMDVWLEKNYPRRKHFAVSN